MTRVTRNGRWCGRTALALFLACAPLVSSASAWRLDWLSRMGSHWRHGHHWRLHGWHPWFFPRWVGVGVTEISPPIGTKVTYLPDGYAVVTIDTTTYYHCGNVYLRSCPGGYVVVALPNASANRQPAPAAESISPPKAQADTLPGATEQTRGANPSQASLAGTVTVNVPNANGGYTSVTLTESQGGYTGPQGEFYSGHPTVEQLRVLYGK